MFHGGCRKVSKVLSLALEPISKSAVHYLAKKVSSVKVAKEPRYRRCIAVDETKLSVKGVYIYVWSAVDVDSRELLALEASYGRSSLNALSFLKKALRMCTNKPLVLVDRGPWYMWALERLGLKYRYQRLGLRNRVERFFGYLKQRTRRFYNNINTWKRQSIEDYTAATAIIGNLTTLTKVQGGILLGLQDPYSKRGRVQLLFSALLLFFLCFVGGV
jgi:transposase-like protein